LKFDPPIEVESTMGKLDPFYSDVDFKTDGNSNSVDKAANVINKNGLLHITEVVGNGEIISIELQPGLRLDKMRKGDEQELQIYITKNSLLYCIISGKQGAVELSAMVIDDNDHFFSKLKSNLIDTALREYFVTRTLTDSNVGLEPTDTIPEIMNKELAARYLGVSISWLEKKSASGELPRTKHFKYRKGALDIWMNQNEK